MKYLFVFAIFGLLGATSIAADSHCQLNGYYTSLSSPVLTKQIPLDNVISKSGSLRNYTWTLPENALPSDISNDVVDDLSVSFNKKGDMVAVHLDLAASLNRKSVTSSSQIQVTHVIKDFIISIHGGSTGLVAGDSLAVEVSCKP